MTAGAASSRAAKQEEPLTAGVLGRLAAAVSDALTEVLDDRDLAAARAALDRGRVDLHRDVDGWIHIRIGGPTGVVVRAHVLPPDPRSNQQPDQPPKCVRR